MTLLTLGLSVACAGEEPEPGASTGGGPGDESATGGGSAAPSTGGTSSGSNPDPELCGGAYPDPCASDRFCLFGTSCGTVGNCTRQPEACDGNYEPVCGCDGVTYSNACEARSQGVSVQNSRECSPSVEQIACGGFRCEPTDYCLDKGEAAAGTRYVCLTIPQECIGSAVCDCVNELASCTNGSSCTESAGIVTRTCK